MLKAKALIEKLGKHELMRLMKPYPVQTGIIHRTWDPEPIVYAGTTEKALYTKILHGYCRRGAPSVPDVGNCLDLVTQYFDINSGEEWLETQEEDLESLPPTVWVAVFTNRHGHNYRIATSRERVIQEVADWCREFWGDQFIQPGPAQPQENPEELVQDYIRRADMDLYIKECTL